MSASVGDSVPSQSEALTVPLNRCRADVREVSALHDELLKTVLHRLLQRQRDQLLEEPER